MLKHGELFFSPLIAAMAGNVGCNHQQLLCKVANNTLSGSLFNRLVKEVSLVYLMG
jgi:magnesium transporter